MHLCFQLQTLKKDSLFVDDYILQMRSISDGLLNAGHIVLDDDLILYVLGGLGAEFEFVVVNLTTRRSLPSFNEVQSILQTREMRVQQNNASSTLPSLAGTFVPSANTASKESKQSNFKSKGKYKFSNKGKVLCQLCGKKNHVASKCFKRFDVNFHGVENTNGASSQNGGPQYGSSQNGGYQANFVESMPYGTSSPSMSYFNSNGTSLPTS